LNIDDICPMSEPVISKAEDMMLLEMVVAKLDRLTLGWLELSWLAGPVGANRNNAKPISLAVPPPACSRLRDCQY
jgi:hypothetical protein